MQAIFMYPGIAIPLSRTRGREPRAGFERTRPDQRCTGGSCGAGPRQGRPPLARTRLSGLAPEGRPGKRRLSGRFGPGWKIDFAIIIEEA